MWAAIIPTVRPERPGTSLDQTAGGSCSTRYVVARLLVRHAAMIARPGPSSLGTSAPSIRPSNVPRALGSAPAPHRARPRQLVHPVVLRHVDSTQESTRHLGPSPDLKVLERRRAT